MRMIDLAIKDLSEVMRDRRSLLFLIGMPIIFTWFMGLAYRGSTTNAQPADNRIALVVVDPGPGAPLNKMLFARLASSDSLKVTALAQDEAMIALQDGKAAGVLLVPVGFSDRVEAGEQAQLQLIVQSGSALAQSLHQLLRVPISQLMSAAEIARISADVQSNPDEYAPALAAAWSKWVESSKVELVRTEQAVGEEAGSSDWTGGNPYNQASPGIMVQFAIFGLINSAQIIVHERKTRTLQRLMTTAMRPWEIVAGHMLGMFALTFMQMILLVVFGQLVLHVQYAREPLAILLICIALGLWMASMGLLLGVVARADDQVVLFSMIAMFLFSGLGGAWFPLEAAGGAFATIGRLMPSAWAMKGFQNVLIRGQGLGSAWLPAAILAFYALGFFLLAVWRFRKMNT